jgi:hypothetical protein
MSKVANTSFVNDTKQSIANNPLLNPYRNKLINGNFDFWQRATSQTSTGYGSADRWTMQHLGSSKTASRQDFSPGQTVVAGNPVRFCRTVVTSAAGAANFVVLQQNIEGATLLSGKLLTVTLWAKADANRNIAVEIGQTFGSGGSPSSYQFTSAKTCALTTSWQQFSFTVQLPSVSGFTFGTAGNDGTLLSIWFDAGSSFNSRNNSLGQQSGTFDIARVSVVEGDATDEVDPFYGRHYSQELVMCQRYYEVGTCSLTTYCGANAGFGYNGQFTVTKRAAPTMSASFSYAGCTSGSVSASAIAWNASATATGGPQQVSFSATWTADAEI